MHKPLQGIRFKPPPLELSIDLRWLLMRAFGPPGQAVDRPDGDNTGRLARESGLAPRLSQRTPLELLKDELGRAAGLVAAGSRQALQHAIAYESIAETVAQAGADLGARIVALKGFALHAAKISAPGSREVGDIDLLLDPAVGLELHSHLASSGFEANRGPANDQHLPPLAAPGWGVVDLHFAIRGVEGEKGKWLGASDVLDRVGSSVTATGVWVPDRALLAAHAISHCIEQHSLSPNPYPLLRAVGDLLDLLPASEDWETAWQELETWLEGTVSLDELSALRDLCLLLGSGRSPGQDAPGPARLLAHFIAHRFDATYRCSLTSSYRLRRLAQARRQGTLLGYARRKLTGLWRAHSPD